MARIRTIKPEFWTSEQVMECSRDARLLFIGLWNFADDTGRHPYNPKQIKALIFPADNDARVEKWLGELVNNSLLLAYEVDGKRYLQITGWRHQKIDKPQPSKHPDPLPKVLESSKTLDDHSSNVRLTVAEPKNNGAGKPAIETVGYDSSSNIRRMLDDHSTTDRKGEDRKGEDKIKNADPPAAALNGSALDADLYRRGKEVLGKNSGGMIKNLLASKNGSIPQARAALETASEKQDCREYIGAIIRGRSRESCAAADDLIT